MNTLTVLFPTESSHAGFLHWLYFFERENKIESNAKIAFIRDQLTPVFSRWTLAPDAQFDAIFAASLAYNARVV